MNLDIKQEGNNSCAIKCQQILLRDYGCFLTEQELVDLAKVNGWFCDEYGTLMRDNGKLLACHGVQYKHSQHNKIANIKFELENGHRIIVNVNHHKLEDNGQSPIKCREACHAVIVTGINDKTVTLANPATGNPDEEYPIETFVEAWKDSHCYMLATTQPAPYHFISTLANVNLL